MSVDVAVSLCCLVVLVLCCQAVRRLSSSFLLRRSPTAALYAAELVSTFQLCACTHELKLLAELGGVDRRLALSLTYAASVTHALTFGGAVGNPCAALERAYRGALTRGNAARRIGCQFVAARVARAAAPFVWGVGLSDLHRRHTSRGFGCPGAIRASVPTAAAVELACAFAVQTAATHVRTTEEKYRVHAIAAVITTCVYAGGHLTGAVFNPALAFSTQFFCSGNTFLDYTLVYWVAPVLGMITSVLLSDRILPLLWKTMPLYCPPEDRKRK